MKGTMNTGNTSDVMIDINTPKEFTRCHRGKVFLKDISTLTGRRDRSYRR